MRCQVRGPLVYFTTIKSTEHEKDDNHILFRFDELQRKFVGDTKRRKGPLSECMEHREIQLLSLEYFS